MSGMRFSQLFLLRNQHFPRMMTNIFQKRVTLHDSMEIYGNRLNSSKIAWIHRMPSLKNDK